MKRTIFVLAVAGVIGAFAVAYLGAVSHPPLPPAFTPAINPYPNGIYAEGIVESYQPSGSNISVNPEVTGTVKRVLVAEGESVRKGTPLLLIDDAVQRATTLQLQAQAQAARAQLELLLAEPRPESLAVFDAQIAVAEATLKGAEDVYARARAAYALDARTVSKNQLDSGATAVATARANLAVVRRQRELSKAGAWSYQVRNQRRLYEAAEQGYRSAAALLDKYTLRAPSDGVVLVINPAVGALVSTQGTYDTYTQSMDPVLVLGTPQDQYLQVRCYVDEILIPRLPKVATIQAQMAVRGTRTRLPLEYLRIQPVLSPKIQLTDQRQERVDVRVLPIVFRVAVPKGMKLYPGQLVDVFIAG